VVARVLLARDRRAGGRRAGRRDGQPSVSCPARRIIGTDNFHAEIIWKRTTANSDHEQGAQHFGPVPDCIPYFMEI
jgi:hypothetical protein